MWNLDNFLWLPLNANTVKKAVTMKRLGKNKYAYQEKNGIRPFTMVENVAYLHRPFKL